LQISGIHHRSEPLTSSIHPGRIKTSRGFNHVARTSAFEVRGFSGRYADLFIESLLKYSTLVAFRDRRFLAERLVFATMCVVE